MPEWYVEIATKTAEPYVSDLASWLAVLFFLGFLPGIISLLFRPE